MFCAHATCVCTCVRMQHHVSMQQCVHAAVHTCTHIYNCTQCSVLMQRAHTHARSSAHPHAAVCAAMHVSAPVGVHAGLRVCAAVRIYVECMHTALRVCTRIYKCTQPSVLMQLVHTHARIKQCKCACSRTPMSSCVHAAACLKQCKCAYAFLSARHAVCATCMHTCVHAAA